MKAIDIICKWMSDNKSNRESLEILCDYVDYFHDQHKLSVYLDVLRDKKTLTEEEKKIVVDSGWIFFNEDCVYLPDTHDNYVVNGFDNIRKLLINIKNR